MRFPRQKMVPQGKIIRPRGTPRARKTQLTQFAKKRIFDPTSQRPTYTATTSQPSFSVHRLGATFVSTKVHARGLNPCGDLPPALRPGLPCILPWPEAALRRKSFRDEAPAAGGQARAVGSFVLPDRKHGPSNSPRPRNVSADRCIDHQKNEVSIILDYSTSKGIT